MIFFINPLDGMALEQYYVELGKSRVPEVSLAGDNL